MPSLALALRTRKAGAPHLQSLDCPTIYCLLLDAIGLANSDNGTLWETAGRILVFYLACTVLPLYYRIISWILLFSADRRATAPTTTSSSHAAIRQKKPFLLLEWWRVCFLWTERMRRGHDLSSRPRRRVIRYLRALSNLRTCTCSLCLSFIVPPLLIRMVASVAPPSGPKSSLKYSRPCSSVVHTMRSTLRVPITNSFLVLPVLFSNSHFHLSSIFVPFSGRIWSLLLATSLFIIPLPPKTFLLFFSTLLLVTLLPTLTH